MEAWRSKARKEPAPKSRCDCPCPSNSRLPDAISLKSIESRGTTEPACTRLTAVADWTIADGPGPLPLCSQGEQIYGDEDVGVRAKAVAILRTRMATASPINAPSELTAKSAQSACRPGEKY